MIAFRKPSTDSVRRFLDEQRCLAFSYAEVGATAASPRGYNVDHHRVRLGTGEVAFLAASAAFARWQQFRLGWVEPCTPQAPIQAGEVVAVMVRVMRLWCLNACRIVYVVDERGPIRKIGFAYGTLPGHVEMGEERFLLEWNQAEGSVWYDILAFSRPNHLLARISYPYVRRLQKRFARESMAAMLACLPSDARHGR